MAAQATDGRSAGPPWGEWRPGPASQAAPSGLSLLPRRGAGRGLPGRKITPAGANRRARLSRSTANRAGKEPGGRVTRI